MCSADAEYTTIGATPDRNAAGCWNTSPNYNRWFKFQATSPFVTLTIKRGGTFGTIRRINAAIWESDGITEVACNRYVGDYDNVVVGFTNLTVGNWYYISVDNYSGYRGTFTICMDNTADYDYYEGAIEVPHTADWCSADAEYTTIGAAPDRNAAAAGIPAPIITVVKFRQPLCVTLTIKRVELSELSAGSMPQFGNLTALQKWRVTAMLVITIMLLALQPQ
ncbi:MAG: hypothetical protein R2764_17395 [Bacteroidales bacterium]